MERSDAVGVERVGNALAVDGKELLQTIVTNNVGNRWRLLRAAKQMEVVESSET